jgi:hypothetical protein
MSLSRRARIAAAAAHFRKPPTSAIASPVPPASRPTLTLKLKPVAVRESGTAIVPAASRTAKAEGAGPALPVEAPRPPARPAAVSVTAPKRPASTPAKTWSLAELRGLVEWMRATWPAAFAEPVKPLALGAGALITSARPEGRSHKDIGAAIRFYVNSDGYLEALASGGARRIELDGGDAGPVEEGHREHARERLEERMAKRRAATRRT